jgi:hypothetical protein
MKTDRVARFSSSMERPNVGSGEQGGNPLRAALHFGGMAFLGFLIRAASRLKRLVRPEQHNRVA